MDYHSAISPKFLRVGAVDVSFDTTCDLLEYEGYGLLVSFFNDSKKAALLTLAGPGRDPVIWVDRHTMWKQLCKRGVRSCGPLYFKDWWDKEWVGKIHPKSVTVVYDTPQAQTLEEINSADSQATVVCLISPGSKMINERNWGLSIQTYGQEQNKEVAEVRRKIALCMQSVESSTLNVWRDIVDWLIPGKSDVLSSAPVSSSDDHDGHGVGAVTLCAPEERRD